MYDDNGVSEIFSELNKVSGNALDIAVKQWKYGTNGDLGLYDNKFFKHVLQQLGPDLIYLLNIVIYLPNVLTACYVIPLYKNSIRDEVEDFRGITVLSTLGKLFTRILNNRLNISAE